MWTWTTSWHCLCMLWLRALVIVPEPLLVQSCNEMVQIMRSYHTPWHCLNISRWNISRVSELWDDGAHDIHGHPIDVQWVWGHDLQQPCPLNIYWMTMDVMCTNMCPLKNKLYCEPLWVELQDGWCLSYCCRWCHPASSLSHHHVSCSVLIGTLVCSTYEHISKHGAGSLLSQKRT